jgi:hypothetical protein
MLLGVVVGVRPLAPRDLVDDHRAGQIDAVRGWVLQHLHQVCAAVYAEAPVDDQLGVPGSGSGSGGHAAPRWSALGYG